MDSKHRNLLDLTLVSYQHTKRQAASLDRQRENEPVAGFHIFSHHLNNSKLPNSHRRLGSTFYSGISAYSSISADSRSLLSQISASKSFLGGSLTGSRQSLTQTQMEQKAKKQLKEFKVVFRVPYETAFG